MNTATITPTIPGTYEKQIIRFRDAKQSMSYAKAVYAELIENEVGSDRIYKHRVQMQKLQKEINLLWEAMYKS